MRITEIAQDPNIWRTNLRIGQYLDPSTAEFEKADDYLDVGQLITAVETQIAAGIEPQVVTANPAQLFATQDWLSNYGSDGALFDEYEDLPVVYRKGNRLYILDGHHRSARALKAGRSIPVYVFSDTTQR
jgi:hypothetical protein